MSDPNSVGEVTIIRGCCDGCLKDAKVPIWRCLVWWNNDTNSERSVDLGCLQGAIKAESLPVGRGMASDELKEKFGGIEGLPTTMLYDRQGVLRKSHWVRAHGLGGN